MTEGAPRVSTIPTGVPFVDALARGLLDRFPDPEALADVTLLLPTRRACRALQEAFLRESAGRALLLPSLLPLGDLDAEELLLSGDERLAEGFEALPPVMPPLTRQLLLTRLILRWAELEVAQDRQGGGGRSSGFEVPSFDQALRLAQGLAEFLDEVETEGLRFEDLSKVVPEAHAEHWQHTLRFLAIVGEALPALQQELGSVGPAERRRRLHELQLERWRGEAPAGAVIAAGSTGSIPSTAALLDCIARLPGGEVVLPGLDRSAEPEVWERVREDPGHPQHNLARLLERLGIEREAVTDWCDPESGASPSHSPPLRAELVELALIPAEAAERWRERIVAIDRERAREALAGVVRLDLPDAGAEASAVALILREALETPGRRAALVTPDRALARRVAAALGRWGIEIDDSAGRPLAATPPAQFLRLTAALAAEGCAPLGLLAALKHPLAAGGQDPAAFRRLVRDLERTALRGPRPAPGFDGLRAALDGWRDGEVARREREAARRALAGRHRRLSAFVSDLERMAAPFLAALDDGEAAGQLDAHLGFAERLAADADGRGADRLWAGEAGEALAGFVAELREALADGAARVEPGRYPAFLEALLAGRVVRPRWNRHPRLAILGPLEARLLQPDVLVLGGLIEGSWPAESEPGPWLSRPMRREFGLPPLERRVGLAAHDLVQALGAGRVYLTRAERVEGTPTVASRWLLRLDALLEALGLPPDSLADPENDWAGWAEALDHPQRAARPLPPPAPTPPLEARPTRLSVTRIETWMRDPYALYADRILGLRPLEAIDADPGAADRGTMIHDALEAFIRAWPERLPDDALEQLLAIGEAAFAPLRARPAVRAFWWPRFERIARWIVETEQARRPALAALFAEVKGELAIGAEGFRLTARADRIERRRDGGLVLIDYKTGQAPTARQMESGLKPQLPLEAALLARGAFPDLPAALPVELAVWRLGGGDPAGEIKAHSGKVDLYAERAWSGLEELVRAFADPGTPYHARPRGGSWLPQYGDYDHLARVKEWSSAGGEAE
ncbi:ATP-dependent helicase/nuclease subunit B [Tistlia consotensis]|uniref:ATP-dependent helicase/nuclease subunit B n=1 Tax=Tistlia consotensis USBA 355 TaxID=560819 RepID=A0A1Y6BCT3_9PROT|nr:double-strand break repair protein AddB [Tistlia consotensis]SME94157.1 ATP-dependent helicase/nuclease subunit B [Tistlia consotensis USBA 355]SNR29094.1 ATP-dependent helicase/nuclease subunit B [Tistlia consotensis]